MVVAWLRDLVGLSPAFIACPKPQDEPSYRLKPAKGKGVRRLFESNRSHGWFLPRPLLALKQILTGVGCPSEKAQKAGALPDFGLWPQPDALAVPELTCTAHIKLNRQA